MGLIAVDTLAIPVLGDCNDALRRSARAAFRTFRHNRIACNICLHQCTRRVIAFAVQPRTSLVIVMQWIALFRRPASSVWVVCHG
jgi:hypothetical protein